jgi:predicted PurR-regulated permease PerM
MSHPPEESAGDAKARRAKRIRRRRPGWGNADVLRTAALVIAMYLAVQLLWFANALAITAFLGVLFGLAVSSGVDFLSRWRIPRGVGAAAIVLGFFGALVGFGAWMAPTLHVQGVELRRRLPDALDRVEQWIDARQHGLLSIVSTDTPADTNATTAPGQAKADSAHASPTFKDRLGDQVGGATRYLFPFLHSTAEVVTGFFIIIFLSIYIAVDPDLYRRGIMHLFPHGRRERAGEILSAIAAVLRRWMVTQLIAMCAIGAVTTILLLLLHVKAAFALGLLAGLFEFIPTVGPILSALPAIGMAFLDSPEKAASVAIAFWGIQFMENHLLIPLLMKGGMDLPPVLTILSQALMALVFGFLGLMCAVPALAATMVAVKMLYVESVVGDAQPDAVAATLPVHAEGIG